MEALYQYTDPILEVYKKDVIDKLEQKFIDTPGYLIDPFLKQFDQLCKEVIALQKEGKKGKVHFIAFSFLYSNLLLDRDEIRIDMLGEEQWLDEFEVYGAWNPKEIFAKTTDMYQQMLRSLSSNYIKVRPDEATRIYRTVKCEHYAIAFYFLPKMIDSILELKSYQEMDKTDVVVTVGDYRDRSEVFRIYSEDGNAIL